MKQGSETPRYEESSQVLLPRMLDQMLYHGDASSPSLRCAQILSSSA
jgi:hypothetical protein